MVAGGVSCDYYVLVGFSGSKQDAPALRLGLFMHASCEGAGLPAVENPISVYVNEAVLTGCRAIPALWLRSDRRDRR